MLRFVRIAHGDVGHGGAGGDRLAQEASRTAPPALALQHRVGERATGRQFAHQGGHRRRARLRSAHVEGAGLVVAAAFGHQAVPVVGAEQGPDRDGAHVGAAGAHLFRRVPDLEQPAHLVFAVGVDVGLGDGDRQAVAFPGFLQQRADARGRRGQHARGLDVGMRHAVVLVAAVLRIALGAVVQPALAGGVVVDADDVGRAGVVAEPEQVVGRGAGLDQVIPHLVLLVDHPAQQVPGQPAPLVEEVCQPLHLRRAVGLRQIVGLDQFRIGVDGADGAHRQDGGFRFDQQGLHENAVAFPVRVPDACQTREARRGQDFVDRGVVLGPGVACRYRAGVLGELFGEGWVDQARMLRTAAMVDQADDRRHAEPLQGRQARVGPGPVGVLDAVGGGALPQDGIADGLDAEGSEAFDVLQAAGVAVAVHLAEVRITHAVDGAFESAPKRQLGCGIWLDMLDAVHEVLPALVKTGLSLAASEMQLC